MTEATTPGEPVWLTPANFDSFVAEHDVVLVDVWAEWCGPCRQLDAAVEALAAEPGVAVGKIDYDDHPDLADSQRSLLGRALSAAPGVTWGLPSLFVVADGTVVERSIGVDARQGDPVTEATLRAMVEPHL